jgi:hypothetical protein
VVVLLGVLLQVVVQVGDQVMLPMLVDIGLQLKGLQLLSLVMHGQLLVLDGARSLMLLVVLL